MNRFQASPVSRNDSSRSIAAISFGVKLSLAVGSVGFDGIVSFGFDVVVSFGFDGISGIIVVRGDAGVGVVTAAVNRGVERMSSML